MYKNPITFRSLLKTLAIMITLGIVVYLLQHVPFINALLHKLADFMKVLLQNSY